MNKLVFDENEILVKDAYSYIYDYGKGKQVLRIRIIEGDVSFETILKLKNNKTDIKYYILNDENNKFELKDIFTGYSYDFTSNYKDGEYSVEIMRQGKTELDVIELTKTVFETTSEIENLTLAVAELLYN